MCIRELNSSFFYPVLYSSGLSLATIINQAACLVINYKQIGFNWLSLDVPGSLFLQRRREQRIGGTGAPANQSQPCGRGRRGGEPPSSRGRHAIFKAPFRSHWDRDPARCAAQYHLIRLAFRADVGPPSHRLSWPQRGSPLAFLLTSYAHLPPPSFHAASFHPFSLASFNSTFLSFSHHCSSFQK